MPDYLEQLIVNFIDDIVLNEYNTRDLIWSLRNNASLLMTKKENMSSHKSCIQCERHIRLI